VQALLASAAMMGTREVNRAARCVLLAALPVIGFVDSVIEWRMVLSLLLFRLARFGQRPCGDMEWNRRPVGRGLVKLSTESPKLRLAPLLGLINGFVRRLAAPSKSHVNDPGSDRPGRTTRIAGFQAGG